MLNPRPTTAERGAVAIEYGLLALLIASALVAAFTGLQGAISQVFVSATNTIGGLN